MLRRLGFLSPLLALTTILLLHVPPSMGIVVPLPGEVYLRNDLVEEADGRCRGEMSTAYGLRAQDYVGMLRLRLEAGCVVIPEWSWHEPAVQMSSAWSNAMVSQSVYTQGIEYSPYDFKAHIYGRFATVAGACPPIGIEGRQETWNWDGGYSWKWHPRSASPQYETQGCQSSYNQIWDVCEPADCSGTINYEVEMRVFWQTGGIPGCTQEITPAIVTHAFRFECYPGHPSELKLPSLGGSGTWRADPNALPHVAPGQTERVVIDYG